MDIEKAILRTLCYSSVFNYPLTKEELYKYLLSKKKVSISDFERHLKKLPKQVISQNGYFMLTKKQSLVKERIVSQKTSLNKIELAKAAAQELINIPTVLFVGISGGVSMQNASENDDIDLFVITQKHTLFLTRLFCVFKMLKQGVLRRKNDSNVKDKICLNLFVEDGYVFQKVKQNLYTAHEVVQIIPLFDKENCYARFLKNNFWAFDFLPNAKDKLNFPQNKNNPKSKALNFVFIIFNLITKYIQLVKIGKNKTSEIISDQILAFHPLDYQEKVLLEYEKNCKFLHI